jgi:hypothetical protein
MKFLIQKINGEIRHDFAFTLLESLRFKKWLSPEDKIVVKFANTFEITDPDMIYLHHFGVGGLIVKLYESKTKQTGKKNI